MNLEIDGKKILASRSEISEQLLALMEKSPDKTRVVFDSKKMMDLQTIKSVPPETEITGGLLFILQKTDVEKIVKAPTKCILTCYDLNERHYTIVFYLNAKESHIANPGYHDSKIGIGTTINDSI